MLSTTLAQPVFKVREIPVYGDTILSPMDGLSDMPFRALVRSLGSAMSYTEFVNAIDIMIGDWRVDKRLSYLEEERPIVFQIFDNDPDRILAAVLRLEKRRPDIIDINMGCPAKNVSGRGAGVGLMRTPQKIARIFQTLTHALDIPVTGKIRLGWDQTHKNYLEVAKIVQDNGGSLLAVHGRTRDQAYGGQADWDAIAEVKQALTIPVIGNGDVKCVADIARIKVYTGCDAVMIGRAALMNPWIFSGKDRQQVSPEEVYATASKQLGWMMEFYGPEHGLVMFRKFAVRYLGQTTMTKEERIEMFECADAGRFLALFHDRLYKANPDPLLSAA